MIIELYRGDVQMDQERKEITVEQETLTAADSKKLKVHIRELEEENNILKKF